jgi:hypothetical protein
MLRVRHNRQSQAQMQKRPALRPGAAFRCVAFCGVGRKAGRIAPAGFLKLETSTTTRLEITRLRIAGQVSNQCKPYLGSFAAVYKPNFVLSVRHGETQSGQDDPIEAHRR